jgi:ankyrin repeat protein
MSDLKDKIKLAIISNKPDEAISLIDQYLKQGGNINDYLASPPESEKNWNVLFWACLCDTDEVLKYLLRIKGLNINTVDTTGYTPLHLAAFHGKIACVKLLVDSGADLTSASNFGETLHELVIERPYLPGDSLELKEYIQQKLEGIRNN